jgi:hypothetical protein
VKRLHHEAVREAIEAYSRAITPTTILTQQLCGAVAQMLAIDMHGPVAMVLPGPVKIIRDSNATEGDRKHG